MTLERAAERCINVLLELIKQKVNYVVQEAVVVIKDIFRRYPNRHGLHPSIISVCKRSPDGCYRCRGEKSGAYLIFMV